VVNIPLNTTAATLVSLLLHEPAIVARTAPTIRLSRYPYSVNTTHGE